MPEQDYSFFESVNKSFDKAAKFTKWENGLLEQIKACNAVYRMKFPIKRDDGSIAFDDAVNQVSGTWRTDRKPSNEFGILVHIMVDDIELSIKAIIENGGKIVQPVGMEAPEMFLKKLEGVKSGM